MFFTSCGADRLDNCYLIDATPTPSFQEPPSVVDSSPTLLPWVIFALVLFSIGPIGKLVCSLRLVDKSHNFIYKSKLAFLKFSSKFKLKLLEESSVVQIKSKVADTAISHPIGFIIKPIECDFVDLEITVEVVIPRISSDGNINYSKWHYQLDELDTFSASSLEYITLKPLAFILEQRLGAQQDIVWLNQRRTEISNTISKVVLANLESDSMIACKQELVQVESAISKLDRAQIELDNYIKESLATYAIAKLDCKSAHDKLTLIYERLEEFETKRQETKDFVDAYLSLKSLRN